MKSELEFGIALARDAGHIMLKHFKIGVTAELKADQSPVTIADTQINSLVIDRVKRDYPGHGVIGEEESYEGLGDDIWVCDPIDGTNPYRWGVPTNVFSLALVRRGVPVVGVVFDPYLNRMYTSVRGEGAHVNGLVLRVNSNTKVHAGRFACTGPVQLATRRGIDVWSLRSDLERASDRVLVSTHSTVYEGMLIASGQLSGGIFPGTNAHDVAAMKVIVEQAGGTVTSLRGEDQRYDRAVEGVVASNGHLHEALLQMVARRRASP